MPIPCPGSESFGNIFGAARRGPTPLHAFLRANLALIRDIATSSLGEFLAKECDEPCEKLVAGPAWERFATVLTPHPDGGWQCITGGDLRAEIKCIEPVEASDEELVQELLALLNERGQLRI